MVAFKLQKGVTMLEMMLALAIASSIMMMGLKMYKQYQSRLYVEQVRSNITTLFQAMTNFYRAQCSDKTTPVGVLSGITTTYTGVTLATLQPYLSTKWEATNSLVPASAYFFQFNPTFTSSIQVNACVVQTSGSACVLTGSTLPTTQAQVVIWNEQVIIQMASNAQAKTYKAILGADCIVSTGTGICTSPDPAGKFLVFQRLPSATSDVGGTGLWPMMPMLKQFNLQYSHDQMYELTPGTVDTNTTPATLRNYLCGA